MIMSIAVFSLFGLSVLSFLLWATPIKITPLATLTPRRVIFSVIMLVSVVLLSQRISFIESQNMSFRYIQGQHQALLPNASNCEQKQLLCQQDEQNKLDMSLASSGRDILEHAIIVDDLSPWQLTQAMEIDFAEKLSRYYIALSRHVARDTMNETTITELTRLRNQFNDVITPESTRLIRQKYALFSKNNSLSTVISTVFINAAAILGFLIFFSLTHRFFQQNKPPLKNHLIHGISTHVDTVIWASFILNVTLLN
jgi:hypothetical protein